MACCHVTHSSDTNAAIAGMSALCLERRDVDDVVVFDVSGCLTAASQGALGEAVREAIERRAGRLVLNLTRVSDVDAAGLGQIAEARRLASTVGGDVRLVLRGRTVREPLARTHLLSLFPVYEFEAEAVASFPNFIQM